MSAFSEMNSEDLPTSLRKILSKLVKDNWTSNAVKLAPKGAADHYSYRITFADDSSQKIIECNQYNIQDNLKSLVTYVEKHNKKMKCDKTL